MIHILDKDSVQCIYFALFLKQIKLKNNSEQVLKLDIKIRDIFTELSPGYKKYFKNSTNYDNNYGYTSDVKYFEFYNQLLKIK